MHNAAEAEASSDEANGNGENSASVEAGGIVIGSLGSESSFTNSGTISVTATHNGNYDAFADGTGASGADDLSVRSVIDLTAEISCFLL